jgi:hypothetical protein
MRLCGSIRVTTDRGRCPPPPPHTFRTELLTTPIRFNPEPCIRLFREGRDPLQFRPSRYGNRFDPLPAPWATTNVLYSGTSLEAAIAETLLRWKGQLVPGERIILSEAADLQTRRVARFVPNRELTVIDATALGLARIEEVVTAVVNLPEHSPAWSRRSKPIADDIFQCGADEYTLTQQWGAWFRSQHPRADGIIWVSRQFNAGRCIALFDDRCGEDLELASAPVDLYAPGSRERKTVDRMLAQLRWGIES